MHVVPGRVHEAEDAPTPPVLVVLLHGQSCCITSSRGRPCSGIGVWGTRPSRVLAHRHQSRAGRPPPPPVPSSPSYCGPVFPRPVSLTPCRGDHREIRSDPGRMRPRIWAEAAVLADQLGFDSVWYPSTSSCRWPWRARRLPGTSIRPCRPPHISLTRRHALVPGRPHDACASARTSTSSACAIPSSAPGPLPRWIGSPAARRDRRRRGLARVGVAGHRGGSSRSWGPVRRGHRGCRRLWSEETITHDGPHFAFEEVAFEPKPPQGSIPILVGGESATALRRAAWLGDGWIGMSHTPDTVATQWRIFRTSARTRDRSTGVRGGRRRCVPQARTTDGLGRRRGGPPDRNALAPHGGGVRRHGLLRGPLQPGLSSAVGGRAVGSSRRLTDRRGATVPLFGGS